MTALPLNPSSPLPLATQVACHFRSLIESGQLREGDVLPKTRCIANASQPIVLQAYRQLQSEGLVKVRRTHGTVVTAGRTQQCFGIILRQTNPSGYPNAYLDSLVLGLMRRAVFHDNAPQVYMLNPPGRSAEDMLPASFLTDLAHNAIAGLFVHPYDHDYRLTEWLRERQLPFVMLAGGQQASTVEIDNLQLLKDGVRRLLEQGSRHPMVLSTFSTLGLGDALSEQAQPKGVSLDWRVIEIKSYTAAEIGRGLADEWLAQPVHRRADGILITDDWLAAGFVNRVSTGGVRIPDDLRVVVGCHRDQLQTLLSDCDCLVLDPLDVVDELIKCLTNRLGDPEASFEATRFTPRPIQSTYI